MNLADRLVAPAASLHTIYCCVSACHSLPAAAKGSKSRGAGFCSAHFHCAFMSVGVGEIRGGRGSVLDPLLSFVRVLVESESTSGVTVLSVLFIQSFIYLFFP